MMLTFTYNTVNKTKTLDAMKLIFQRDKEITYEPTSMIILDREVQERKYHSTAGWVSV
jgi:hypothetical protein